MAVELALAVSHAARLFLHSFYIILVAAHGAADMTHEWSYTVLLTGLLIWPMMARHCAEPDSGSYQHCALTAAEMVCRYALTLEDAILVRLELQAEKILLQTEHNDFTADETETLNKLAKLFLQLILSTRSPFGRNCCSAFAMTAALPLPLVICVLLLLSTPQLLFSLRMYP